MKCPNYPFTAIVFKASPHPPSLLSLSLYPETALAGLIVGPRLKPFLQTYISCGLLPRIRIYSRVISMKTPLALEGAV